MTRTTAEILTRIKAVADEDWMGTIRGDLIDYLPYEHAKPYLKESVSAEEWEAIEIKAPGRRIHDYLTFAIGKAQNHRGLSAGRSVDHLKAWVWMMGDARYQSIDWENYAQYGVPILKAAAEMVNYPWPNYTDLNRMAQGLPCEPNCCEGCG